MDTWDELYLAAKKECGLREASPSIKTHRTVCAIQSASGKIYTGFSIESGSGVMDMCAERVAALRMYADSGETVIRNIMILSDKRPLDRPENYPCGVCREFLMQLSPKNADTNIMVSYEPKKGVRLGSLIPNWHGKL